MSNRIDLKTNSILLALAIVTVGAALHLYQLVLEGREIERVSPFLANLFPVRLHGFLLLFLLITAAGLVVRRRWGLVCSIMGLLGVLLGYFAWLDYTHRYLHLLAQNPFYLEHPELAAPNSFGLIGGRWWDIVFLALFVALFVWEVKLLFTRAEKLNRNEVGS